MDSNLASTAQEEGQSHDTQPKTTGSKRKFASQVQFESLQAMVADMRSEMVVLIFLIRESVIPPIIPCLDDGSQSASQSMVTFANNENQFFDPSQGNQFAIHSCGNQLSTMPSGSLNFRQTMSVAPNPASPMANSRLSTESTEGSFVPTFHNMEGEISDFSNQGCSGDSTIHFVEEELLGPKISEGFATYVEDFCHKRILNSKILKLKDRSQRPANCPALSMPTVNPSCLVSKKSTINAYKTPTKRPVSAFHGPNWRGASEGRTPYAARKCQSPIISLVTICSKQQKA